MSNRSVLVTGSNYTGKQDKFLPIQDRLKIKQLMESACNSQASIVLWTTGQEHVIRSKLLDQFVLKQFFYVENTSTKEMKVFTQYLIKQDSPECQILIYQPNRAVVGFKCTVLGLDEIGLQIAYPPKMFRVQRRAHQRYKIREGYAVDLQFCDPMDENQTIQTLVKDVSIGGLSFQIGHDEATGFAVGTSIKDAELQVRNRNVQVDLRVQNLFPISKGSKPDVQVGCAFTKISFDDVEFLSFYIGENTIQFSG